MEGPAVRTSVFKATAIAAAAHVVLDLLATRLPWTTPPYLLLEHASATFRDLLFLDRRTLLVSISAISAGVNGAIAGLFATAMASAPRRVLALGTALTALWIFSGGLMTLVYLDPPAGVVVGSLAAGAPRSFLVAWLLERLVFRPAEAAPDGGATPGSS